MKRFAKFPVDPPAGRSSTSAVRAEAAAWVARRDAGFSIEEERAFAAWLKVQPAHLSVFEEISRVWTGLDRPLHSGVADLVLGELQARANRRRRRLNALVASVALVSMAAMTGWLLRSRPAAEPVFSTKAVLLLPSVRSLPDGSVIELGDGAEVAVEFSPAYRRVVLKRGEAHFQVAKNPARPFIVAAGGVELRAVGTAFVVQLGPQDIQVFVTEGRIAVDSPGRDKDSSSPIPPTTLAQVDAGNGVAVNVSPGSGPQVRPLSLGEQGARTAWLRPRLEFAGTPLIEAAALMNRHGRVQLHIEDPTIAQLRISGVFGAENTEAFVRLLESTFDIKAEHRSETEIVLHHGP